jgi:hypothetical protein
MAKTYRLQHLLNSEAGLGLLKAPKKKRTFIKSRNQIEIDTDKLPSNFAVKLIKA